MKPILRALMVEDSEDDAILIQETLRSGGYDLRARRVETEEDLRQALRDEPWDIVLSDYSLPSFSAHGTLEIVKETGHYDLPVIVVSGTVGEDVAVETLKLGAEDYLLKQNLTRLVPAVARALDAAESRRQHRKVEHMKTLILENSLDLICTVDAQGCFLEVSSASRTVLGYEPAELTGIPFEKLVHPDELAAVLDEFQAVMQGRSIRELECRLIHKSGQAVRLTWSLVLSKADGVIVGVARDITERKQTEEALREERDFSDAVLNGLPGAFYQFDDSGRFLRWNKNFERITGYRAEELAAMRALDFFAEDEKELVASRIAEVFEKGESSVEADFLLKDGRRIPYLFTGMRFEQNGRKGYIGVALDISWRKNIERRLREERDFSNAVLNSLPGIFYHYDDSLRFLRWNKNHELVTGYSAEELAAMHPLDFFAEGEKELIASRMAEVFEKGEAQVEANFLLKDGRRIPYLFTGMRFERDGRRSFVGVGLDIEARKRMEEALREETAMFEAQVESSLDGILVVDRHGKKVIQNQRMTQMWRIPSNLAGLEDVAPQLEFATRQVKDPDGFLARIAWLYEHPEEISRDVVELVDGAILDRYSAPVLDKEGRYYGRTWIHRDITEERHREQKLAEALALEKELSEQARAGDRAKSEFLAVMSHEVRTPLNGILGFAELLRQAPGLSPESQGHARVITRSGEALLRILDDILDLSRLEAGRMNIEKTAFSPRSLLDDIRALLSRQAAESGVQLLVSCAPGVPERLEGDAGRLRQVLLNLAGNALKFTEEGSVRIALSPLAGRPATHVFSVADTGCGITPEELDRIFQPFTQADSSTSRRHNGTGLGLTISRRLTELLGGTLTVESTPGKGSEFRVVVPLEEAKAPDPPAGAPDRSSAPLDASFASRHPLRMLIAEDDPINLKLIQTLVRRLGYAPLASRNGREAVEIFQKESPDFLLMDLQMPEMDGIEATEKIRAIEKAAHTKLPVFILALTANIFPADRQRCFDAGMDGYLNKPAKISSLAEIFAQASLAKAAD